MGGVVCVLWEVDGVFVGKVANDLRGEEFGVGRDTLGTEVGNVGLQPAAESGRRYTREAGKLGFCVGGRHGFI